MPEVDVYGIRHHGPGSARAVAEALGEAPPDVLCVEMPAGFAAAVERVGADGLEPPVALVAYDPRAVAEALYYPLARFSPEWVAMRWAAERGVPVVPIDLPAPLLAALARARAREREAAHVRADPLGELARSAGYDDRERWWETTFERRNPGAAIFPAVAAMIAALREAHPEAADRECRLREAHMARAIRTQLRGGAERVAVVCGAWHAPVLAHEALAATARGYAALRRGLKGPKLLATWIPWTYERLRSATGYGAGVRSPVWYELLYDDPARAAAGYLARTARELREAGLGASAAQVVDAVELLGALVRLRGIGLPGLEEIREAALGSLAEGSAARLDQVAPRVESLRTTGRVPAGASSLPLQLDLEGRLRAARLAKPYRDMEAVTRELDLRKPAHLGASRLLCQLLLLDIPFGDRLEAGTPARGTFRERWHLHWRPEFALRLLAAHAYGQRVPEAAAAALRERLDAEPELPALAAAVDLVLHAGLFDQLRDLTERIRARAVDVDDPWVVARALPPLLRLARYPSLRGEEAGYLTDLTGVLLPKLCVGLEAASTNLDENGAYEGFGVLKRLQPYLGMVEGDDLRDMWSRALERVAFGRRTHRLLAGFALRTLADAATLPAATAERWLRRSLGRGVELGAGAHFLEGFLWSSASVLVHQPAVLAAVDGWLQSLSPQEFRGLLPALRRTASTFPLHERRRLSALVTAPPAPESAGEACADGALPPVLAEALRGWLTQGGSTTASPGLTQN